MLLKRFLYTFLLIGCFFASTAHNEVNVYVFLSEPCPMSQDAVAELNRLQQDFAANGVNIVGVFPNFFSTDSSIQAFKKEFLVEFDMIEDQNFALTDSLGATITPEVVVLNSEGKTLYRGKINEGYSRPGKRRPTLGRQFLREVLTQIANNKPINVMPNTPMGCDIVRE